MPAPPPPRAPGAAARCPSRAARSKLRPHPRARRGSHAATWAARPGSARSGARRATRAHPAAQRVGAARSRPRAARRGGIAPRLRFRSRRPMTLACSADAREAWPPPLRAWAHRARPPRSPQGCRARRRRSDSHAREPAQGAAEPAARDRPAPRRFAGRRVAHGRRRARPASHAGAGSAFCCATPLVRTRRPRVAAGRWGGHVDASLRRQRAAPTHLTGPRRRGRLRPPARETIWGGRKPPPSDPQDRRCLA